MESQPTDITQLLFKQALRPHATIIMKEKEGKLHFDLDHINTFSYEHMGDDIGTREAKRASVALTKLIAETLKNPAPDSPVYTYIPALKQPLLSNQEYDNLLEEAEKIQNRFSEHLSKAEAAVDVSDHATAAKEFGAALSMNSDNPYLVQQTALHTYKTGFPSLWLALVDASRIISALEPEKSNDPETLGISGAIYKNMWLLNDDRATLDAAIASYERGFDVRGDYYNGENAATCLELRSKLQADSDEILFDKMSAKKIRNEIVEDLMAIVGDIDFDQRSDQKWIFATLANCYFAAGNCEKAVEYEALFLALSPVDWEKTTYENGKKHAKEFGER